MAVHQVAVNVVSLAIVVTRMDVMPAFLFNSARSARMIAIISASALSERDHRLYSFHCLVLFGPSLWQREPVPWPSSMEVFVGHQHRKPNPRPWPLQSGPRPSTISMEIVSLQSRTTNPLTCHAIHHLWFQR